MREKVISRTIKSRDYTMMAINRKNAEVFNIIITVGDEMPADKDAITEKHKKMLLENYISGLDLTQYGVENYHDVVIVEVQKIDVIEKNYSVPIGKFMMLAISLDSAENEVEEIALSVAEQEEGEA